MNFKLATRSYGLLSFLLICPITALSSASVGKSVCGAAAKLAAIALDKKAIEEMSGCYTVDYSFKETRSLQPNYEKKPEYHVQSLEYISCEQRGENRRKLQHLLKAGPFIKIHHWSQEWTFRPDKSITYKGERNGRHRWEIKDLPKSKDVWQQHVRGVSSEPRYSSVGVWRHGKLDSESETPEYSSIWAAEASAPLPRREYSTRTDIHSLSRFNIHEVTPLGWLHEQLNKKMVHPTDADSSSEPYPLVVEHGQNLYRKIDESACSGIKEWWQEQKPYWDEVDKAWDEIIASASAVEIEKREGTSLYLDISTLIGEYQDIDDLRDEASKDIFRQKIKDEVFSHWVFVEKA